MLNRQARDVNIYVKAAWATMVALLADEVDRCDPPMPANGINRTPAARHQGGVVGRRVAPYSCPRYHAE